MESKLNIVGISITTSDRTHCLSQHQFDLDDALAQLANVKEPYIKIYAHKHKPAPLNFDYINNNYQEGEKERIIFDKNNIEDVHITYRLFRD